MPSAVYIPVCTVEGEIRDPLQPEKVLTRLRSQQRIPRSSPSVNQQHRLMCSDGWVCKTRAGSSLLSLFANIFRAANIGLFANIDRWASGHLLEAARAQ